MKIQEQMKAETWWVTVTRRGLPVVNIQTDSNNKNAVLKLIFLKKKYVL